MKIDRSLLVKYGLKSRPVDQKVGEWLFVVDSLIIAGKEENAAGEQAARQVFGDYNSMLYDTEADSIDAILSAARVWGANAMQATRSTREHT